VPRPAAQSQLQRYYLPVTNEEAELANLMSIREKLQSQIATVT
jgi:hypothetical protein